MKAAFEQAAFELVQTESGYTASIDGQHHEVELLNAENGRLELRLNGQHMTAYITSDGLKRWVTVNGRTFLLTIPSAAKRRGQGADRGAALAAPMPGQIRSISVKQGEAVKKGQTLLVVEAMKMEIRVQAPRDGSVAQLFVKQGDTVQRGQRLIELEEEPASQEST